MDLTSFFKELGISGKVLDGLLPVMVIFVVAVVLTTWFIPSVRRFAVRAGLADLPNERRLNKEPLPNLGGLAIFAGVMAALILAVAMKPDLLLKVQVQVLAIALGATIMLLVGFIDDQFSLPPLFRLLVQVLAACLLIVNGIHISATPRFDFPPFVGTVLTIIWVVGITNAVNLMDGMDGLVGGLGFIAGCALLAASAQFADRGAATLLLAAVAGACLGFLRHNFNPSRIILGDAGAYFLGFTLAAVSILGTLKVTAAATLVTPLLFLAVPILDTTQVVVRRLRRGVNPLSTPGRDHLHHQLLGQGLSQRRAVLVLWAVILAANILGMLAQGIRPTVVIVTTVGVCLLLAAAVVPRMRETEAEPGKGVEA